MNRVQIIFSRIALSFFIAISVGCVSLFVMWWEYRYAFVSYDINWSIRHSLDDLYVRIEFYRHTNGYFPFTLEDVDDAGSPFRHNKTGEIIDYHGNPIQYETDGDSFDLYSLGRDGKPGGVGLDAEIFSRWTGKRLTPPSLRQFYHDCDTRGMVLTSLAAGAVAGLIAIPLKKRNSSRAGSWKLLLVRVGCASVASIFAAVVIGIVHLPSGH